MAPIPAGRTCGATVEVIAQDDEGRNYIERVDTCPGTLDGPVPNAKSNEVESSLMGDGNLGYDYFCATCGQTTVIADDGS